MCPFYPCELQKCGMSYPTSCLDYTVFPSATDCQTIHVQMSLHHMSRDHFNFHFLARTLFVLFYV
uniref:Uncharacterized protein n=1 Tax=Anguilla anguilla TaxID=7936 RepID=A0A0E9QW88_ANGAN